MSAIDRALSSLGLPTQASASPLTGGCIHDVQYVTLKSGDAVVCKIACGDTGRRMLESECRGLGALAEVVSVTVPTMCGVVTDEGTTVLVLEYLPRGGSANWELAGQQLAAMHMADVGERFGSAEEVWLGSTCLTAGWDDDWCSYLSEQRLRPLLRDVVDSKAIDASAGRYLDKIIGGLKQQIPSHPQPSLLHGDLWAGNLHPTSDGCVAMLDPASSIGDAVADIAMTKLFGGVPNAFYQAWNEAIGELSQERERIAAAQMLHLLNHVRLFGDGYVPRLMAVAETLE